MVVWLLLWCGRVQLTLAGNHKTEEPEFEGLTTLTPDDMPAYRAPTPDR